ncbi:MAG: M23 family metallopeptidase [Dysosmobacter sp.]|nr:M23 family metallopeptidase [Dysosmobacter sp.]
MKNDYRDLMETVSVPEGLENRVLAAARQKQAAVRPEKRRRTHWLRNAACAACALALLLGTVTWRPGQGASGGPALTCSFGLTAYAADTGAPLLPNANGGLAFASSNGMGTEELGRCTGCLFQVRGENIRTLTLSVDRGGLYRSETRTGLTKEEVRQLFRAEESGDFVCSVYGEDEDGPMSAEVMTVLGADVTGDYNPDCSYGFWVPPEDMVTDPEADLRQEAWANIDTFDGARLTVAVTFADGTRQEKTYTLSTGRLRAEYGADGTLSLLPQLAGDDEPFVYGVYVADEADSRWLQWPVEGSRTVSLSNPYGQRQVTAEQPTSEDPERLRTTVHSGIDIPADRGTPVLAAADGTVTDTGFDPVLGNYLVLDHGDGLETVYACCRSVDVKQGDTVKAGEMIAAAGSTGQSTGPHLHFEVRQDGEAQNPVAYFDSAVRDTLRAE